MKRFVAVMAVWSVIMTLLMGQFGIGPELVVALADSPDSCCDGEVGALDSALETDDALIPTLKPNEPAPEHAASELCPPGCDDCSCCPGVMVAVAPHVGVTPGPLVSGRERAAAMEALVDGQPARIFKPPRTLLV